MDNSMNDGGPAFPSPIVPTELEAILGKSPTSPGMSLRDWLAGMALSSMTAAPDYSTGPCDAAMVERAYRIADVMLAQRAKKT